MLLERPEFGPVHVTRFFVDPTFMAKTRSIMGGVAEEQKKIKGFEVQAYQVEPYYYEVGVFPLFPTDQANGYALVLPAEHVKRGIGTYRYRLIAIYNDGSKEEMGVREQQLERTWLEGVRPLRVEWKLTQ